MSDTDADAHASKLAAHYEELLKPCRDLAANWNVDIFAKLSEYLADLNIDIGALGDEDFSKARVNFQHAALVIEGGTCVYSRKVDYLYGLVFSAADMIFEARGKTLTSLEAAVGSPSGDEDVLNGTRSRDDTEFLLLDDELIANQPDSIGITLSVRNQRDGDRLERNRDANRLVSVPLHLLPPGPHQARRASSGNPDNAGLRIPEASINVSTGALILDGIGAENDLTCPFETPSGNDLLSEEPTSRSRENFRPAESDSDNDEGALPDFEDHYTNNMAFVRTGPSLSPARSLEGDTSTQDEPQESRTTGRYSSSGAPVPSVDAFLPLNPHDTMGIPKRPAVFGKTWMSAEDALIRKENNSVTVVEAEDRKFDLTSVILGSLQKYLEPRTNRFVSLSGAATSYKARLRLFSTAKRQRAKVSGSAEFSRDEIHEADQDTNIFGSESLLAGDTFGICEDGVDEECDLNEFCGTGRLNDCDRTSCDSLYADRSNTDVINAGIEQCVAVDLSEADLQMERMVTSYEESCRRYLHESSVLWQEHATDSQLEQRVADWRSRIEPLLLLEEERDAFDIKVCGASIVNRFQQEMKQTSLAESDMRTLFKATESFEVCRNFLATLQLANNYEVVITEGSADDMLNPRLKLLASGWNIERTSQSKPAASSLHAIPLEELHSNRNGKLKRSASRSATPRRERNSKRIRQSGNARASVR